VALLLAPFEKVLDGLTLFVAVRVAVRVPVRVTVGETDGVPLDSAVLEGVAVKVAKAVFVSDGEPVCEGELLGVTVPLILELVVTDGVVAGVLVPLEVRSGLRVTVAVQLAELEALFVAERVIASDAAPLVLGVTV
jgi:hypothetical protein